MGREVTKTPDTKLRSNTRHHDGQEPTLLYYATQNVVRALTYAVQGPARTLTKSHSSIALAELAKCELVFFCRELSRHPDEKQNFQE